MNDHQKTWMRLGLIALITAGFFFALTGSARAQAIIYGDKIPAGTTVDNDVILFGNNVAIDGNVKGDVFALGQTVNVSGTIDGSLAAIAETVTINDEIKGTTYNASVKTELSPTAKLGKNLYYAGVSLLARPGSTIGRDLFTIAVGAELTGKVDRNVVGIIGPVQIINLIYKAFTGGISLPVIGLTEPGFYALNAPGATGALAPVSLAGLVKISDTSEHASAAAQAGGIDWNQVGSWSLARLREFITLLILGALLAWLFPVHLKRWAQRTTMKPWLVALYGLAFVILGFIAAIVVAVFVVIFALGFAFIKLGGLAFLIASLGLLSVGVAFFVFYLFAFYVSKVVFAYLLGMLIFRRLAPRLADGRFWPFLLGLVLYIFLVAIPYLGWIFALVAVLLGTGAIGLIYFSDWNLFERAVTVKEPEVLPTGDEPETV